MTREVKIGSVKIGGGNPVAIQSMTTTTTSDVQATLEQIERLQRAGCMVVRVAVKDFSDAAAIAQIKQSSLIPVVADIHFDYRLAIAAIENGADKIRINPGNIGSIERVKAVADAARMHGIPIRVGVNGGSLDEEIERKFGRTGEALAESALKHIRLLEDMNFDNLVISCKSSSVKTTVEACRILSRRTSHPLHLGITEAGTFYRSMIKSSMGLGSLLLDDIGDTIRVSITGDPVQEIAAARDILRACGKLKSGVEIVSCPTCGRCEIDLEKIVAEVEEKTKDIVKPLKIAVMGCVVNGIGEGKDADIGLAGGKDSAVIFAGGEIVKRVNSQNMVSELIKTIEEKIKKSD